MISPSDRWRSTIVALFAALFLLGAAPALAAKVGVAVPKVKGPRSGHPGRVEFAIRKGLNAAGARAVAQKSLARTARRMRMRAADLKVAEAAGADFSVRVKLRRKRRRIFASAKLLRASTGEVVAEVSRRYRGKQGASKAGKAIGRALAKAAISQAAPPEPPAAVATPPEPEAVQPVAPSPVAPGPSTSEPSSPTVAQTVAPSKRSTRSGEERVFRLMVGAGSQVSSAYTVSVGGDATGLAYTLSPLMLLTGGVEVSIPGTDLIVEAEASWVPVKYGIDVDPPVDPTDPSGQFLAVGGGVRYRLTLAGLGDEGRLSLSPVLAFNYQSLSVQEQSVGGDPNLTVVVSYTAMAPRAGLVFGLEWSNLLVELQGRGGWVVSYSESPTTTGDRGGGLDLLVGGRARFWLTDMFGLFLRMTYEYQAVGLSGTGTRVPFDSDPDLVDATVFSGAFRAGLGGVLAL